MTLIAVAAVFAPGSLPALVLVLAAIVAGLMFAAVVAATPAEKKSAQWRVRRILDTMLGARTTLLFVRTDDERAATAALREQAAARGYVLYEHDVARGLMDGDGRQLSGDRSDPNAGPRVRVIPSAKQRAAGAGEEEVDGRPLAAPPAILDFIRRNCEKAVYVLRDFDAYLADAPLCRRLRTLARDLISVPLSEARVIVVLTPGGDVPPKLATDAAVVDWPRPDASEWPDLLRALVSKQPQEIQERVGSNGTLDRAAKALAGMTAKAGSAMARRSLVQTGTLDADYLRSAKSALFASMDAIEVVPAEPGGAASIGGLTTLKRGLEAFLRCMGDAARAYGIAPPKGVMLLGLPGTGKSHTAKCLGSWTGLDVVILKVSSLESKWVGEGVQRARAAFAAIDAMGPCIVLIDEVEKGLAGSTGDQGDGGSSKKLFGEVLAWMQDRRSEAFVILTANDVSALPPELMRKGRVDEIYFLDLPNRADRADVLRVTAGRKPADFSGVDFPAVAAATDGFVGAELAALVDAGLKRAFLAGKPAADTADFVAEARATVPQSAAQREKITALREWAAGRAVRANDPETLDTNTAAPGSDAELDLG